MNKALPVFVCCALLAFGAPARPNELSADAINGATFAAPAQDKKPADKKAVDKKGADKGAQFSPVTFKAQVLLDRAGFSPGVIDGRDGENVQKAIRAFARERQLNSSGALDEAVWAKLTDGANDPVVVSYTLTQDDVKGPFTEEIPSTLEEMAELPRLGYRGPGELLAEKFHMSEDALKRLNPGKSFEQAGTAILVSNVPKAPDARRPRNDQAGPKVSHIEIDKRELALRAFGEDGRLLAYFPVSIGSEESPPPSGKVAVKTIAWNPVYSYDPRRVTNGKSDQKLSIKAGPNNPVGLVWISLDVETYGIHGTPEPEKISKSYSSGCVRLTNWDALKVAAMVSKGTPVDFKD